jgi:hypothetical protein
VSSAVADATKEATAAAENESQDVGSGQEVAPEPDAKGEEGSAEPAKAAPAEEEESFGATAEELERVQNSPELLKIYKSLQRGFTKKTTAIAEVRKQLEQKAQVADWIQADPDNAIKALAQARGITIAEAKAEVKENKEAVTDELESEWAKAVGPDVAKILRPLIEKTAGKLSEQMLAKQIAPLQNGLGTLFESATDRGLNAAIREFGATVSERGEDWDDDVQAEMAQVMGRVAPGLDENGQPIPVDEYLDQVHSIVMARRERTAGLKSEIARLKKAQASEPRSTVSVPDKPEDRITSEMSDDQAIALAVKQAKAAAERRRR